MKRLKLNRFSHCPTAQFKEASNPSERCIRLTGFGDEGYPCNEYGKSFRKIPRLINHQRMQTGETLPLYQMWKLFEVQCMLPGHQKTHSGDKACQHNDHGKAFMRSSALIEHWRIHTEEKPYRCKKHKKSFRRNSGLVEYLKIHPGEKPYECNECGKAFPQNSGLK